MKRIFLFPILFLFFTACNKKEVLAPDFDVTIKQGKATFKVNEEVNFIFSGSANYITFYSGQAGQEYQFRDRIENGARTDAGVPLQNMTTKLGSYTYVFQAAGAYKVSFVVSNTNIYGSKEDVKEFDLTIEP